MVSPLTRKSITSMKPNLFENERSSIYRHRQENINQYNSYSIVVQRKFSMYVQLTAKHTTVSSEPELNELFPLTVIRL
jgi:hypothetical protein